jgi:predicted RNA-binding Zn ribbon-like protein
MTTPDLPRPVVPRPVAVVRDFVNTTDHETGTDDLTTPAALVGYLRAEGLLDGRATATEGDLALALTLRRGLRAALEQNHDGVAGPLPELEAALASLPVRLTWGGTAVAVEAGEDVAGDDVVAALARIGLAALQAASNGIWHRLKICASDECEWAYYDRSKNRSRSWCEYGCGNKIKTRAYRARQKQG